ncbi:hypothetical protein ACFL1B_06080 [Nanoarchaeota archaeon]
MDKQGFLVLRAVLILTVVAALVILAFFVVSRLWGATVGGDEEESSTRNFQMLVDIVDNLFMNPNDFASDTMAHYIHKDHTMIGFSRDDSSVFKLGEDGNPIPKPPRCEGKACLCIYNDVIETGENANEHLISCQTFEGDVVFFGSLAVHHTISNKIGDFRGATLNRKSYQLPLPDNFQLPTENLIIYGKVIPISEIYVERYTKGSTSFIMITPVSDFTPIRAQYYRVCSAESVPECRGKHLDEVERFPEEGRMVVKACKFEDDWTDKCYSREITNCPDGYIESECSCGMNAYMNGYCLNNVYTPVDCSEMAECADFCDFLVGPGTQVCNKQAIENCNKDPCDQGCYIQPNPQPRCISKS